MVKVLAEPSGEGWSCEARVDHGGEQTEHVVTVTGADLERWGRGSTREDVEHLVARSFEFLLQREPASSILKRFDLAAIQRYFPEYDRELRSG